MSKSYETDPRRAPRIKPDDTVIRSEHGRIAANVDYRSHWFVLVKGEHRRYALLVQHGAGEERIELPTVNTDVVANIIAALPSDDAYILMHKLYDIHKSAAKNAQEATSKRYCEAFIEGRLKKRKLPAQGRTKVWIEDTVALREVS